MAHKRVSSQGFTLIELVVVIVILGILMATAMPKLSGIDSSAKTASVQGGLAALSSAASIYYAANKASAPLVSIIGQATFSDALFSVASATCNLGHNAGADSVIDGSYFTNGTIAGGSTVLASTILDAKLCSD